MKNHEDVTDRRIPVESSPATTAKDRRDTAIENSISSHGQMILSALLEIWGEDEREESENTDSIAREHKEAKKDKAWKSLIKEWMEEERIYTDAFFRTVFSLAEGKIGKKLSEIQTKEECAKATKTLGELFKKMIALKTEDEEKRGGHLSLPPKKPKARTLEQLEPKTLLAADAFQFQFENNLTDTAGDNTAEINQFNIDSVGFHRKGAPATPIYSNDVPEPIKRQSKTSLELTGNEFITLNSVEPTQNFTYTGWVKPNAIGEEQTIATLPNTQRNSSEGLSGGEIQIKENGDVVFHPVIGNNRWFTFNTGAKLTANQWSHWALTVENGKAIFHLNGEKTGETTLPSPIDFQTNGKGIMTITSAYGNQMKDYARDFTGKIDNYSFTDPLTEDAINAIAEGKTTQEKLSSAEPPSPSFTWTPSSKAEQKFDGTVNDSLTWQEIQDKKLEDFTMSINFTPATNIPLELRPVLFAHNIQARQNGPDAPSGFIARIEPGGFMKFLAMRNDGNWDIVKLSGKPKLGEENIFVMKKEGKEMTFWLNGQPIGNLTLSSPDITQNSKYPSILGALELGAKPGMPLRRDAPFKGDMTRMDVWIGSLTGEQLASVIRGEQPAEQKKQEEVKEETSKIITVPTPIFQQIESTSDPINTGINTNNLKKITIFSFHLKIAERGRATLLSGMHNSSMPHRFTLDYDTEDKGQIVFPSYGGSNGLASKSQFKPGDELDAMFVHDNEKKTIKLYINGKLESESPANRTLQSGVVLRGNIRGKEGGGGVESNNPISNLKIYTNLNQEQAADILSGGVHAQKKEAPSSAAETSSPSFTWTPSSKAEQKFDGTVNDSLTWQEIQDKKLEDFTMSINFTPATNIPLELRPVLFAHNIQARQNGPDAPSGFIARIEPGGFMKFLAMRNDGNWDIVKLSGKPKLGEENIFVMKKEGKEMTFWLNGQPIGNLTLSSPDITQNSKYPSILGALELGAKPGMPLRRDAPFKGDMTRMDVWIGSLTGEQLASVIRGEQPANREQQKKTETQKAEEKKEEEVKQVEKPQFQPAVKLPFPKTISNLTDGKSGAVTTIYSETIDLSKGALRMEGYVQMLGFDWLSVNLMESKNNPRINLGISTYGSITINDYEKAGDDRQETAQIGLAPNTPYKFTFLITQGKATLTIGDKTIEKPVNIKEPITSVTAAGRYDADVNDLTVTHGGTDGKLNLTPEQKAELLGKNIKEVVELHNKYGFHFKNGSPSKRFSGYAPFRNNTGGCYSEFIIEPDGTLRAFYSNRAGIRGNEQLIENSRDFIAKLDPIFYEKPWLLTEASSEEEVKAMIKGKLPDYMKEDGAPWEKIKYSEKQFSSHDKLAEYMDSMRAKMNNIIRTLNSSRHLYFSMSDADAYVRGLKPNGYTTDEYKMIQGDLREHNSNVDSLRSAARSRIDYENGRVDSDGDYWNRAKNGGINGIVGFDDFGGGKVLMPNIPVSTDKILEYERSIDETVQKIKAATKKAIDDAIAAYATQQHQNNLPNQLKLFREYLEKEYPELFEFYESLPANVQSAIRMATNYWNWNSSPTETTLERANEIIVGNAVWELAQSNIQLAYSFAHDLNSYNWTEVATLLRGNETETVIAMLRQGTTTVVVGEGITDTGGGMSDVYVASSNLEVIKPSTNSLDRWYATAGEGPIDVNWTLEVQEQGKYKVIISGLPEWDLENAHVIISGISTYQLEKREHLLSYATDSFDLSPGVYTFTIGNLGVPETPTINKAWFYLEGKPEEESRSHITASYVKESKFIADHKEEFLDAGSIFQVQGVEGKMDVHELINHFAPILHFHESERFAVPFDVDEFLKENPIDMTGSDDADMDLSRYALVDQGGLGGRFTQEKTASKVYASVLKNDDKGEIAINYYFFFPRSNWSDYGGKNTHEGDWEGATVFLSATKSDEDSDEILCGPKRVAVGQHIKSPATDGGDEYEATDNRLSWEDSHVKLYVGLGGHAIYAYSGVRDVFFRPEIHNGNIAVSTTATYIPRSSSQSAPNWLLYSGKWGAENLSGLDLPDGVDGDAGAIGPLFQSYGHGVGTRWLDPWDWSDDFDAY